MQQNAFAPLRYTPFRLLVSGRVINRLGGSIAPLALAFAVLDLTGSVKALGLVVAVNTLANVIFVLFGGVIADRLPRNVVMVTSNVISGGSEVLLAILLFTHHATMPVIIGLAALGGMTSALSGPASAALTPQTVPENMLKAANALNRLGSNASSILGTAVAGILVASVGSAWCIAFDAATYFVSAACFLLVRVPAASERGSKGQSLFEGLRLGWDGFRSRTWLWVVVIGFMFFNAAISGSLGVLGPAFADDTIGRKAWGFVLAAETVGMIFGAFIALRVKFKHFLAFGVLAVGLNALLPFFMAAWPVVSILILAALIGGIGVEQFGIGWELSMQENVPADMLARVYSYDMLGSFIAMPIGQVAAGPIAATFGTSKALYGAAAIMVASVVFMLASKSVRTLKHDASAHDGQLEGAELAAAPGTESGVVGHELVDSGLDATV